MKFTNEDGQEISLKRSATLPGYEVTLAEDTVIDSAVNNPFFKGINILQLPKKLKGFRDNPDLNMLFTPQVIKINIKVEISDSQIVIFQPKFNLVNNLKIQMVNQIFTNGEVINPSFINLGLHKINLKKNTVIGDILILNVFN